MMIEYSCTMTVGDQLRESCSAVRLPRPATQAGRFQEADLREVGALEEWESYVRRSASPEEVIEAADILLFHNELAYFRLVAAGRLRILRELQSGRSYESIHELAKALGREPKDVRSDLRELERHGLVRLAKRNARRVAPEGRVGSMTIRM